MRMIVAVALFAAGCSEPQPCPPAPALPSAENTQAAARPSASELFELRKKCSEAAEKVLPEENGGSMQRSMSANYSIRLNRCFADVNYTSPGLSTSKGVYKRYLLEAQGNQMIAAWESVDGKKSGEVYDWLGFNGKSDPTPQEVAQFIADVMKTGNDER